MSIHCYINDDYYNMSSDILQDISKIDEFINYIKNKFNIQQNQAINYYCNFSSNLMIDLIETKHKDRLKLNYLVIVNKDNTYARVTNTSSLYGQLYHLPRNMTAKIFKELFNENQISRFYTYTGIVSDDDIIDINKSYFITF